MGFHMGFVMDKVALGQVFLRVGLLRFLPGTHSSVIAFGVCDRPDQPVTLVFSRILTSDTKLALTQNRKGNRWNRLAHIMTQVMI